MTLSAVATRYANALADVVVASGSPVTPRDAVAQLERFAAALAGSPELQNALLSPAVPPARKRVVVGRIATQLGMARILHNFLFVLVDHRRTAQLPQIAQSFDVEVDARLGFARAEVSSAQPLAAGQQELLEAKLSALTGRKVRARYGVDASLIGGMTARIGSTIYDGSVRGQLKTLARRLGKES